MPDDPDRNPDISQTLVSPYYVKLHDGQGKAFAFLVTKEDEGEHLSGTAWVDDTDNALGLSEGWAAMRQIGRGDASKGASWSPF